jgi:D-alanyl-lipoteichoic acid acyltransferase DltB (MBOAT superfamily)
LAVFVNQVYASPSDYEGISMVLAMVFFSFQIFCDFSGYSDIAIGSAKCMGYDLMTNFNKPYTSKSIGEFWSNWHISLSTWFRDYVYIPLGGNRVSESKKQLNIFIVFLLSGLWHGANWTYIVWGFLHGIFRVTEIKIKKLTPFRLKSYIARPLIFILITFAWVFFRAESLGKAKMMLGQVFVNPIHQLNQIIANPINARLKILYLNQSSSELFLAIFFISVLIFIHHKQKLFTFDSWVSSQKKQIRWSIYYGLIISFILTGVFNKSEFIYFQF